MKEASSLSGGMWLSLPVSGEERGILGKQLSHGEDLGGGQRPVVTTEEAQLLTMLLFLKDILSEKV